MVQSQTEAVSVGVGRRRQKGLFATRSGARNRKECKMTCTLGPVDLSVEMLGAGAGSADYSLRVQPTQVPVCL